MCASGRSRRRCCTGRTRCFYRPLNGAQVAHLFMSLIHTCELSGADSFEYLTELHRHARELEANLSDGMRWNHRETLAHGGGLG